LLHEFQSPRLRIQPWINVHLDTNAREKELIELSSILSARVTEFLPNELRYETGQTEIETWVSAVTEGSTVFLVRTIEDEELTGVLIVHENVKEDGSTTMRLGYLFGEKYWGRGLATELVRGLVAELEASGFTGEVLGGVEPDNAASASVLEKSGFVAVGGPSRQETTTYRRVFP